MIKALHHGRYSIVLAQITSLCLHSSSALQSAALAIYPTVCVADSVDFENISRYNRRPYFQKGTVVAVSPYTMHHKSAIYKDPEAYEPGRWFDPGQSVKDVQYPV